MSLVLKVLKTNGQQWNKLDNIEFSRKKPRMIKKFKQFYGSKVSINCNAS